MKACAAQNDARQRIDDDGKKTMELGMIGLGRMGANMTERLVRGGHHVVGYDVKAESRARIESIGAGWAASTSSRSSRRRALCG